MINARTRRPIVLCAIVMAMFMGAIEANVIATSMPTIVAHLGDMSLFSWVFSSYLVTQAITAPVYGKMSDLFGRKRVFLFGLSLFLAGSILCGMAWSMSSLVIFRLVQGLGAGAVVPLALTLIGDLYSIEERGRMQGYLASVWGLSSIVGPLTGALIVQYLSWPWIFWINVPFIVVAMLILKIFLYEDIDRKSAKIDYAGAALLLVGLSALMLALTHAADVSLSLLMLLIGIAVGIGVLFVLQERRAHDPVMDFALLRTPLIAVANATTLASGVAMGGVIAFLPIFAQGVLGASALSAGFALSAMSLGWPLATVVASRMLVRTGAKRLARCGGIALFGGCLILALAVSNAAGVVMLAIGAVLLGVGMGTLSMVFLVTIQSTVTWAQRGAATASNMLMRMLGNALGSAMFGGLLNFWMLRHLLATGWGDRLSVDDTQRLLGGEYLPAGMSEVLRGGLALGLGWVFWGVFAAAAIALSLSWRVTNLNAVPEKGRQ